MHRKMTLAQLTCEFCKLAKGQCESTLIPLYYPRSNGEVERFVQTLSNVLRRRESFRRDTEAAKLIIAHSICEKVPDRQTHK